MILLGQGLAALGRSDQGKVLTAEHIRRPEGFVTAELKAAKVLLAASKRSSLSRDLVFASVALLHLAISVGPTRACSISSRGHAGK